MRRSRAHGGIFARMARLVCIRGELEGRSFEIEHGVTIGRAPHNTIALPSTRGVSRDHAKVWKQGARQYSVADLGSTNGTLVNDGRQDRAALGDGDTVQIGEAVFRFEFDDADRPTAPGRAAAASGYAATAPGHAATAPGHAATAPGHAATAPAPAAGSARVDASALFGAPPESAAAAPAAASTPAGPTIVVKERVLQYSKRANKGTQLGWDIGQTAGWQRYVFIAIGLAVAAALFLAARSMF